LLQVLNIQTATVTATKTFTTVNTVIKLKGYGLFTLTSNSVSLAVGLPLSIMKTSCISAF